MKQGKYPQGFISGVAAIIGILWHDDMKKNASFGTAIWITSDGDFVRAESHLEQLVNDNFDLDLFKSKIAEYIEDNYISEAGIQEMEDGGVPYDPNEPGAPKVLPEEMVEIDKLINELEPLQIGTIPLIIQKIKNIDDDEFADYVTQLMMYVSNDGFEQVIFGDEQPYYFAFKRGDIRIRLFPNSFIAELDAANLNRKTGDQIVNALFKLTGGNTRNMPPEFGIGLVSFSGKEPKTQSYLYNTMEDFFEGLMRLTKTHLSRRVAMLHTLLRLTRVFYQRVKES